MKTLIAIISAAILGLILIVMAIEIVPEGHVGIVTSWGKADRQIEPGLHFVNPISENVVEIEVRQRTASVELSAASANQLAISAAVTMNWTIDAAQAMDLFVRYGSVDQFENRIVERKLIDTAKGGLSIFPVDKMIRERAAVGTEVRTRVTESLAGFPVQVDSVQIENIVPPAAYMAAVQAKMEARENAVKEEHLLAQQKLQAQRNVQTAEADRDAAKARADGQAYATKVQAEAEAEAVRLAKSAEADGLRMVGEQLASFPATVQYTQIRQWSGQLPQTMLAHQPDILMTLNQ